MKKWLRHSNWRRDRSLIVLLLLLASGYAIAEENISLMTYYPSPRGVFREIRVGGEAPSLSVAAPTTGLTQDRVAAIGMITQDLPPANGNFDAGEKGWRLTGRGSTSTPAGSENDFWIERWNNAPAGNPLVVRFNNPGGSGSPVGIGTDTPQASLQISTVASVPNSCGGADWIDPATQLQATSLRFRDNPNTGCGDDAYIAHYGVVGIPDRSVLEIANHNDPGQDDIAFMPAGILGIGTRTPDSSIPSLKMEVQGDASVSGNLTASSVWTFGNMTVGRDVKTNGKLSVETSADVTNWVQIPDVYLTSINHWASELPLPSRLSTAFGIYNLGLYNDKEWVNAPPAPFVGADCKMFWLEERQLEEPKGWIQDCKHNVFNAYLRDVAGPPPAGKIAKRVIVYMHSFGGKGCSERWYSGGSSVAVYAICSKP